jgi:hypothetical protein
VIEGAEKLDSENALKGTHLSVPISAAKAAAT